MSPVAQVPLLKGTEMNDDQIRVAIKTVAARLERAVDSKTIPRVSSLAEHVIAPAEN